MTQTIPTYATLDEWIARDASAFSLDEPQTLSTAVDRILTSSDSPVELLGFGEALHGGEDLLILRNRLFQRLVTAHGYSAIAVESSFPRARVVNEYIAGHGRATYETIQETGFSHDFGRLEANRELVEWMRQYNADPEHRVKLRFYGFDSPTEMMSSDSPSRVLHFVLDYLATIDHASAQEYRNRIDPLLGPDAAWENPAAMMDPAQSIGRTPAATALRIETEELISDMRVRHPELVARSDEGRYQEAIQYAVVARQLLNYHAILAQASEQRIAKLLGMRDALMADNLAYIVARERGRGKVLAFAHNSHLRRGLAAWQLGVDIHTWWPAGAHLHEMFGSRYVFIGSSVGTSPANGIGQPEPGTLETLLTTAPGPARLISIPRSQNLLTSTIAALPTRTGSMKNQTYFALTPQSLNDFDWLITLDTITYTRGGPALPDIGAGDV